jgi:hypothetical protein
MYTQEQIDRNNRALVTIPRGRHLVGFTVNSLVSDAFAELPVTIRWTNINFPTLEFTIEDNLGHPFLRKRAERYVLDVFGIPHDPNDFVCFIDGNFTNCHIDNIVVIRKGTEQHKALTSFLHKMKYEKFNRNPYPYIYWHNWTNKWVAYWPRNKVKLGLFNTPDEAYYATVKFDREWYTPNDNF